MRICSIYLTVLIFVFRCLFLSDAYSRITSSFPADVEKLVREWAPLVFLSPGEKFFPGSVLEFLDHVMPIHLQDQRPSIHEEITTDGNLPKGYRSQSWTLVTKESVGDLLKNSSSFLHGRNPKVSSVPVYAVIVPCSLSEYENNTLSNQIGSIWPSFQVTYWMFYPFNQGKAICTLDMGMFGAWPIPKLNNFCWGATKEFGNHVGDWEHVSLQFHGSPVPVKMYVSSHDVGAIYRYKEGKFEFERREIRKGILQRPMFPPVVSLSTPGHRPVLFAARGSHGLWAAPGKHRFVRIPRMYDTSGFGVPWQTWKNLVMLRPGSKTEKNWLLYRGRWGNSKTKCHPLGSNVGINICELSDGPTGIPLKKLHFKCS